VLYILPQFLSGISGYNAFQSGQVLFLSGIPAFAMMPFLPTLLGKVDLRLMIFLGLSCFSASCFMDVHLTAQSAGGDFVISQLLRGMGQILALMPLNQTSVGSVSREDAGDAAGLYNMARNLGGSIGLALLGVFIDRRVENHADSIAATVTNNSQLAQSRLDASAATFAAQGGDPAYAHMQALKQLTGVVHQQAMVISYSECFFVLGCAMILMMPLLLLLRPPRRRAPIAEAH
jgi:DHA2 family multidrug resistance protein